MRKRIVFLMIFFTTIFLYANMDHELWEDATVKIYSFGMMDVRYYKSDDGKLTIPIAEPELSHGSGFLISRDGLIVTNAHVVNINGEKSESISVKLRNMERTFPAVIVYSDEENDIAFLKIDIKWGGKVFNLNENTINTTWKRGEKVWLWGFPIDAKQHDVSLTSGVINRWHESRTRQNEIIRKIQIDATANPGNSGGPVVDGNNRLVGVIHAGISGAENYNLTIPAQLILDRYKEVLRGGYVEKASREFSTDRWQVVSLWSEIGTRMITGMSYERQIDKLMRVRDDIFPEAYVFFAGIFWNHGIELLLKDKVSEATEYMDRSIGLIKKAMSINPKIRVNRFIVEANEYYKMRIKFLEAQSAPKKQTYTPPQTSRTHRPSSSYTPTRHHSSSKRINVKNSLDIHLSYPSFRFYSREGFFSELMKNEKESAVFKGAPFGVSASISFDTNSIHVADWLFLLSGLTFNVNTEKFMFTDKETNEEKTIDNLSLGMMHGFNFRPVRWFYATIYWHPQIWIGHFSPKGLGVNTGFVFGKGFVLGMKGGFYEDRDTKAYAHFWDINIGWGFRMGRW